MRREILEAVFPGIKGQYKESETHEGWWAAMVNEEVIHQINFFNGKFYAETLIGLEHNSHISIPIKAIHLISQYENRSK